jgi:hypothetical protein
LTRARVNVWIFDENEDFEGTRPMYEYFKARRVVKPIAITDELAGQCINTFSFYSLGIYTYTFYLQLYLKYLI